MKNALLALGGGVVGCALWVALSMAGIVAPPVRESARAGSQSACAPDENDHDKRLRTLTDDNASLRSELGALRANQEVLDTDLRKLREAAPKPVSAPPKSETGEKPPVSPEASTAGFTNEDLLWTKLFLRVIKPMLYEEAAQKLRDLLALLGRIHKSEGILVGVTLDTIWPVAKVRRSRDFWSREDFALLIGGKSSGEIELVGDPATPRLKLIFDFEARAPKTWNREIDGVTNERPEESTEAREVPNDAARASEARATAGAMKDRARVVHMRDANKTPQTLADIGMSEDELKGTYFIAADYTISGTAEEFVITVRNVYSDAPYDLVLTCNIKTGAASFNR